MGQAWCKEKSEKAQDSKSPLDRVFVRCAHRIYPGLKEEGSVLGGATQRVTSSEIGYAGSPPRAALLRGQSIDSVDRPFHPSEWVDVNLEVPCTPRASVVLTSANQQRSNNLPRTNGRRSPQDAAATTAGGAPVPPPRRRRRRERRPLPPKPGGHAADDESEPEPLYSQLATPRGPLGGAERATTSADELDGADDSDDEFVAIERILKKRSLEEISSSKLLDLRKATRAARPKNHSTSSLPNVAELLAENDDESSDAGSPKTTMRPEEAAKRPPRHVKTASLPRDASLFAPQTPERIFFSRRIEEDRSGAGPVDDAGDNSIRKIEASVVAGAARGAEVDGSPDCSLRFEADVRTSTPVKEDGNSAEDGQDEADDERERPGLSRSGQSLSEVFHSFRDESSESRDSSSVPGRMHEVDRPRGNGNEDAGYESKSSSHLFSNGSSAGPDLLRDELSSGIIRDATVESCDSEELGIPGDNDAAAPAAVQRTISEESLPREMLVDELDEQEEEESQQQRQQQQQVDGEKLAKDASNEITRQTSAGDAENFDTPPPSPEFKIKATSPPSAPAELDDDFNKTKPIPDSLDPSPNAKNPPTCAIVSGNGLEIVAATEGNLASMTPSLLELEAALSDMLEKKDEEEREAEESSGRRLGPDKSPEPQIVPVKRNRPLAVEDVAGDLCKVSPQPTRTQQQQPVVEMDEEEEQRGQMSRSRLIDFRRADRMNPFNDLKSADHEFISPTDEPPEKPSRLHRISLVEESIDEPLIVPTPPRRRHRSKLNLNSSSESPTEILHTYATNDRLI